MSGSVASISVPVGLSPSLALAECGWHGLFRPDAAAPRLPDALTVGWWQANKPWLLRRRPTGLAHQLRALDSELAAIDWIRLEGDPAAIDHCIARAVALIDSAGLCRLRSRLRVLRRQALAVAQHYDSSLLTRPSVRALEHMASTAHLLHSQIESTALRQALARAERQWSASDTVRRSRELQALIHSLIERLRSMDSGTYASMSDHIVPAYRHFAQDPGEATRQALARHMHAYAQALATRLRRLLAWCEQSDAVLPHLDRHAATALCTRLARYADDAQGGFLDELPPEQVLLQVAELSKLGEQARGQLARLGLH
ncbi:hypothetical protein KAK06_21145 [Ideonella sp. 4Y11]|uniref:Uncharacterized protein n=1 Tax=Ideonella aquatica TaxID=2824119 RepID=A0A941BLZ2_9BURK|nr:hypothetical protein [Ideonella aquatica]MBQ0961468.1 hypothetical protein [Ideonella aquatica]